MLAQFLCFTSLMVYVGISPFNSTPDSAMVILCEVQIFVCLSISLAIGDGEDTSPLVVVVLYAVTLAPLILILPLSVAQLWVEFEISSPANILEFVKSHVCSTFTRQPRPSDSCQKIQPATAQIEPSRGTRLSA